MVQFYNISDSAQNFTAQQSLIKELFDEEDWLKLYQNLFYPPKKCMEL
jgi:hypothetical protein